MANFDTAWSYIRFGGSGDWILNDENGRMIIRVTKNIARDRIECRRKAFEWLNEHWEDLWF